MHYILLRKHFRNSVLRGVGVMHYADLQSDYDVTTALVQIQLCEHYKKTATKLIHLIMGSYLELA